MADLILACTRAGRPGPYSAKRLHRAAACLTPEGDRPRPAGLLGGRGVLVLVTDPSSQGVWTASGEGAPDESGAPGEPRVTGGVAVGGLIGERLDWARLAAEPPDGTYALVRWDDDAVEIVADVCASRTLWYTLDDDTFLASTSQRALVALLGSFELDPSAVSWMLSAGTLGPEVSWDARLSRVPPDGRVTLDRRVWRAAVHERSAVFAPEAGEEAAHVARVRDAIEATCEALGLAADRWVVPLSGGTDSPALVAFLREAGLRPRCVTWTTRASLRNPLSDVSVARMLARRFGVEHEVLCLDDATPDVEAFVGRFVAADEGRNDEAGGYVDGFALWRDLRNAGVEGIVRGDEGFGNKALPSTHDDARLRSSPQVHDHRADHVIRALGLAPQTWPSRLEGSPAENLAVCDARLEQTAYVPAVLAGLNVPKARYVEVVNPLLSRRVVGTVRSLPAPLLARRRAYLRAARQVLPRFPAARFASVPSVADLLASPELLRLIARELTAPGVERVLPGEAPVRVLGAMAAAAGPAPSLGRRARSLLRQASLALPADLAARFRPGWKGPDRLSAARLGFRSLLASRTVALLEEDARALDPVRAPGRPDG